MPKCHVNTERLVAQANAMRLIIFVKVLGLAQCRHVGSYVRRYSAGDGVFATGTWKVPVTGFAPSLLTHDHRGIGSRDQLSASSSSASASPSATTPSGPV